MSFSKSKVARFGEKLDLPLPLQRTSTTEFTRSSRESGRSQSGKNGIVSASFSEPDSKSEDYTAEGKMKLKATVGKHSCLSSKIGRPNYKKSTKKPGQNAEIDGIVQKESHSTVESSKSGPPSSRIPSVSPTRSRPTSLGASRAGSFVSSPGSTHKSTDFHKRSLEMQFGIKTKRLSMLKKELLEKQKPAVELYKAIIGLRNRFKEIEGRELPLDDLKIVEYADVRLMDEKQREIEEEKLKDMKSRLQVTPQAFMDLCRHILDEKCGILDNIFDDEGDWNQDDLIKKIQTYREESAKLEGRIEGRLKEEEGRMRELIKEWYQIAKIHIGEIDSSIVYADLELKLQETEHKLKQTLADLQIEKSKKHKDIIDKNKDLEGQLAKMKEKLFEANKSLEEERTKLLSQKERQSFLEHKMKSAKGKMKEAEMQRQELELQVDSLNGLIRKNEDEWGSKEIYLDARHKELQQIVKTHKEDLEKLERERHSVDVRIEEQRKEFESKELDFQEKIQQLEFELNEIKTQKLNLETENDMLRVKAVNSEVYNHMHNTNKKKLENEDTAAKSTAEMALWQELKETRSALKLAEEKLSIYAEEKTRFLDTISENFREDDTSVNMTSQLMQKEELISTLILQNKQLQESYDESQVEYDQKCLKMKELEEKLRELNEQLFETDVDTEKDIYELHAKLQYEIEHNKELDEQLSRANNDSQSVKEMVLDYENLLKIRDGLLNMMQEKKNATEEQNKSLKDYIVQMREQLNLMSIDKYKKEQELKTLSMLLEEKTGYIDKIEERVAELEDSVKEIKLKRVNLQEQICNADGELRVTRDKISRLNKRPITIVPQPLALHQTPSRENMQQFINHAQNLCTQEAMRFRKKLHSRLALRNSMTLHAGPGKNSNRPQSAQSCTLENKRRSTRVLTTVSDIMRRYKSNEGFDLKTYTSSSTLSN